MFQKQVLYDIDNAHQLTQENKKTQITKINSNAIGAQSNNERSKQNQRSIYQQSLYEPLSDFLSRPRKDFRGQLVEIGFSLISELPPTKEQLENLRILTQIVEALHSGSLIVDDIQDESLERRGRPCLHRIYGTPLALNAGNWLYFWAYTQLNKLNVSLEKKDSIFKLMTETMLKAHFGQSLDIGIRISEVPQSEVAEICYRNIEQKSGALMAMAISFGAIIAQAHVDQLNAISLFGNELGTSLQMFDDIGNLNLDRVQLKHLEDLMLRRPSWVWAFLSIRLSADQYLEFKNAVAKLPDLILLKKWTDDYDFHNLSSNYAADFMTQSLSKLKDSLALKTEFQKNAFTQLQKLSERIQNAYK